MSQKVSIGRMADAILEQMQEYADLADDSIKKAVTKAAKTVKDEIQANAPVRTGKYAESWKTKKTLEKTHAQEITVYSSNRYQIAHLLEFGHAKRNGGRVAAQPHIAAAEQKGIEQLEEEITRSLSGG